ncbi:MAG: hypothetical protein AAF570_16540, partial [Bacteroidota bacterium]
MKKIIIMTAIIASSMASFTQNAKSLGVLEFSDEGILFAGDNTSGAVFAYDFSEAQAKSDPFEVNVYQIDEKVASTLGTAPKNIQINDIAVHPKSCEVYLSVTRGHGAEALPALIRVNSAQTLENIDLTKVEFTRQALTNIPDEGHKMVLRGTLGAPPTEKEIAKSKISLRTLSIVSMEYHNGGLYVAGISNEEFNSVLRHLPYPFNGEEKVSEIEMYHIAHDRYETRAPIRAMVARELNGIDYLVAAYTCSPLVLIPISDLKDGAKVKAKSLGDMGNGQPIDMVPFKMKGEEMLFVTNNSRSPRSIPLKALAAAKPVTEKDFARGGKLDMSPLMPYGPVGKA